MSRHPYLAKWIEQNWTVGQYTPTESFKAIANHSCVCRGGDLGMMAVTGPAEDPESQMQADLFAASPELLRACEAAIVSISDDGDFWKYKELWQELRRVVAKAKGEDRPAVCRRCEKVIVPDEGEKCPECIQAEGEAAHE